MIVRKIKTGLRLFPLLGERIKGEGGRKNHSNSVKVRAVQENSLPRLAWSCLDLLDKHWMIVDSY
jgi:hypothetical protein